MNYDYVAVKTTFAKRKDAQVMMENIVKNKLAACAQIYEIESVYEWDDKVGFEREFCCEIKTSKLKIGELIKFIERNHSYTTPEIIALPIVDGSKEYLKWIKETTTKK